MSTQTLFSWPFASQLHCWKISMYNIFVFYQIKRLRTLERLKRGRVLLPEEEIWTLRSTRSHEKCPQVEIWILYVISKWSIHDFDIFLFFLSVSRHFCLSLPNDSGWIDNTEVKAYLTPAKLLKDPLRGFGRQHFLPWQTKSRQESCVRVREHPVELMASKQCVFKSWLS